MWKVILSNDEEVVDNLEPGAWSKLVKHCRKNNLEIKRFYFNDELLDKNAYAYMVLYESVVLNIFDPKSAINKKGAMAIRKLENGNLKCRIFWFNPQPPHDRLYNEFIEQPAETIEALAIRRVSKT